MGKILFPTRLCFMMRGVTNPIGFAGDRFRNVLIPTLKRKVRTPQDSARDNVPPA